MVVVLWFLVLRLAAVILWKELRKTWRPVLLP